MIKSIMRDIFSYVMSIFILPDSIMKDIEKMLNSFWWGVGNNNKGIRWLAWDKFTCPKNEGSVSFRDFKSFNMAMLAKQGWHIIMQPDTLVARVFKVKYFPRSSLFEYSLGNNPSYVWRILWKVREVLILGCKWRIRDKSKINVMFDPWLRIKGKR
ncbi:unnamed protein product [Lathyrus sativus]|nr:unnamed protein product [Lathyrus sativus]